MKISGVVRPVDKMGRVVIPKEIRKQLKIENDVDSFEVFLDGDTVLLKKYQPSCLFCGGLKESIEFEGYNVCIECIGKLQALKEELEKI